MKRHIPHTLDCVMIPRGRTFAGMGTTRFRWLLCVLLAALAGPGTGHAEDKGALKISRMLGVQIPIYPEAGGAPAAVVRVAKVGQDYQRRGFFRIGTLPLVVAEDVNIEVLDEAQFKMVLASMEGRLGSTVRGVPLELRHVVFKFPDALAPRLRADLVRFEPDGSWSLKGNVQLVSVPDSVRTHRARLNVAGPEAGQLQFASGGSNRVENLFQAKRRQGMPNPTSGTP